MKKILALAAVAALTAGVSAYAANPFSDVTPDDWAFQAVSDLSTQGVVEGYPDGSFKGERNMTRYELAQIIARLMAKEDQLNAEQQATLDKLAGEYADELANLGVRVANLEKKVGNISWSGDARMQYQHPQNELDDTYGARMRLNVSGQVNDKVRVEGRLSTEADLKGNGSADTEMDRIHVVYTPTDKLTFDLGRTGVGLSQTGIYMDEDGIFDGVAGTYDNGKFNVGAGYGRFKGIYDKWNNYADEDKQIDAAVPEAWFVKAGGNVGGVADLSAFYLEQKTKQQVADLGQVAGLDVVPENLKTWGVGAAFNVGDFTIDGDYIKNNSKNLDDAAMWTAGLTYGEVDTDKVGSWTLGVHYVDADPGAYIGGVTAWDMSQFLDASTLVGAKFWMAKAGVAVQKNVELDAYYYFNGKPKLTDKNGKKLDGDDMWGIELNYAF